MKVKFYGEVRDYGRYFYLVPVEVRDDGERILRFRADEVPLGDAVITGNEDVYMTLRPAEMRQLHDLLAKNLDKLKE